MSLAREEYTPVAATVVVPAFPPASALALARGMSTLIFFAHPHCPCTRASLHELDELLGKLHGAVAATIVFTLPRGVPPGWEQGELWESALAMPGVRVVVDRDGREAGVFGVKGSGHTLLYDAAGRLVFSGGITPSRGHEGENPGSSAIASFVLQGTAPVSRTPVFGCPLLEPPAPPIQP